MNMLVRACHLAVAVLLVASTGCSVYSVPGRQPAPVETRTGTGVSQPPSPPAPTPSPEPAPEPAPPPAPAASEAYGPLLARADQAASGGDYEQALALLERAQRIDPDNAEVYLALARTYAAKGDTRRARATAERGLLYCRSDAQCAQLRSLTR
jgi:tetratricopeptide (TPR) repeat protein